MGYPKWNPKEAIWQGVDPDARGVWEWLKAWWKERFWSVERLANLAFADIEKQFERPAPIPPVTVVIGARRFTQQGNGAVVELLGADK